jgi:hypothetical protein
MTASDSLLPRDFVAVRRRWRAPGRSPKPNNTRAGWPRTTTKTFTWSASCCRRNCTRISTTSTPIAAGPTIWPTKSATRREPAPARMVARELDRMYAGETQHPVFVALRGTVKKHSIPKQPFADLIRAFIQDQTVTRYQTWEELFDYCVYRPIRWAAGALPLRIFRSRTPALVGRHLHRAATGQFLAGCDGRSAEDRVYLPLDLLARHNYTVEELFAHKFDARFRASCARPWTARAELFLTGLPLIGMVTAAWPSISNFSAAAACAFSTRSSAGLRRAVAAAVDLESGTRPACSSALWPRRVFRPRRMISLELPGALPRVAKSARRISITRSSCCRGEEERHVRDVCVHALLRRSQRRARRHPHGHGSLARALTEALAGRPDSGPMWPAFLDSVSATAFRTSISTT